MFFLTAFVGQQIKILKKLLRFAERNGGNEAVLRWCRVMSSILTLNLFKSTSIGRY